MLWLVLAATLWSTGGAGIKLLQGHDPLVIASTRSLVSAIFFALLLRGRFGIPAEVRKLTLFGSIAYTCVVCGFVWSTSLTTAANAIILQYTSLLWIGIIGWILFQEKPRSTEIIALIFGAVGVYFCFGEGLDLLGGGKLTSAFAGDLISLFSGFAFALCAISLRMASRATPTADSAPVGLLLLFYGNLITALIGLPEIVRTHYSATDAAIFLWLGVFQLGVGYILYQKGLRVVRVLAANLIALLEALLNPVWVVALVGETPSRGTLAGGLLILTAVILVIISRRPTTN